MFTSRFPAFAVIAALVVAVFAACTVASAAPGNCTAADGQSLIDAGRYDQAIRTFTCLVQADPTGVEGYRGRIEAEIVAGRYSDGLADYGRITAFVLPVHPDARETIRAGYADRLAAAPDNLTALKGASFERWTAFDYAQAIHLLNHLLDLQPDDVFGNLFRGSSRFLGGATKAQGAADLERAISLAPTSADVHFVVADAYTYGQPDPVRAFHEATLALDGGLNTPRVHAILAVSDQAFGDAAAAAAEVKIHMDLVTTDLAAAPTLDPGGSLSLGLVPGRTYEIPVPSVAGGTISIATSSPDFWDTIVVLLAPDGTPVVASDDANRYFAAFDWVAPASGTYRLLATSFEAINTGELRVSRR